MTRKSHTRSLLTSAALLLSAVHVQADITIGTPSSPIEYTNATGSSGTTLVPFSVTLNSIPANDWDNVTYLNSLRSSAWNWGVNVSESSDAKTSDDKGTTQSVISLSWPQGEGPEVGNSPWSYCALYLPELGDGLLKLGNDDCSDPKYSQCEKAVIEYLDSAKVLTDPDFKCAGQKTLPVPDECKTAFGDDAPSQLTMYASSAMSSGAAFISRTDASQSLSTGMDRHFEVVLYELAKKGTDTFPAAIFINCFKASTSVAPILAPSVSSSTSSSSSTTSSSSSSHSSPANSTTSSTARFTSYHNVTTSTSSADNFLTESTTLPATGSSGENSGSSATSTIVSQTTASASSTGKQPAAGGMGAASSVGDGVASKVTVVAGAYIALLLAGMI